MMTNTNRRRSFLSYCVGFALSLLLTVLAYLFVTEGTFNGWALRLAITALALTQLVVQLVCFLHINIELKPRWKLLVFIYTVVTILVLVLGSIWIMYNLDYNHGGDDHLNGQDIETYIQEDEGIHSQ